LDKFIKRYKKAYSKEECLSIIDVFDKNPNVSDTTKTTDINFRGYKFISCRFSVLSETYFQFIYNKLGTYYLKYTNEHPFLKKIDDWIIGNEFNIQKYEIGNHYSREHSEHGKNWYDCSRILVWMIYLNDCNGGTCWPQQNFTSTPEEGDLYIWPASWNYSHYGVPSSTEKYMLTGWTRYHKPDVILPETEPRRFQNMEWSQEI